MKLSVIVPVYNERKLDSAVSRIRSVLENAGICHEIIIVDDGSDIECGNGIIDLLDRYVNVTAVFLSRNFGKENALCAGFDTAEGECAVCIDADMQHPPEIIPDMYRLWLDGYEIVEGVKNKGSRSGRGTYYLCENMFYRLLSRISGIDLTGSSDFKLLGKNAINALKSMPERQVYFRGMSAWIGFKRARIYFDVAKRNGGETKWSRRSLIKLALTGIASSSAFPLYMPVIFGGLFLAAFIAALITVFVNVRYGQSGAMPLFAAVYFASGFIFMLCFFTVGIYIDKIYNEVKDRPRYIINKVLRSKND